MTSVYSNSRYDHNPTIRINTKEIQTKKESLKLLEATLNERISEFRELCLKEGVSIFIYSSEQQVFCRAQTSSSLTDITILFATGTHWSTT